MLTYVRHRVNQISEAKSIDQKTGVELDLRCVNERIEICHDPFSGGDSFEEYLKVYKGNLMIVNIKEEGLEIEARNLLKRYEINNYFFLDCSVPFIVKGIKNGFRDFAVRLSEYEPMEFINKFEGLVDWVWVDCFEKWPIAFSEWNKLAKKFKICIVSPELQGHGYDAIPDFKKQVDLKSLSAICTKRPDLWKE